jgi:hypothetical protein
MKCGLGRLVYIPLYVREWNICPWRVEFIHQCVDYGGLSHFYLYTTVAFDDMIHLKTKVVLTITLMDIKPCLVPSFLIIRAINTTAEAGSI